MLYWTMKSFGPVETMPNVGRLALHTQEKFISSPFCMSGMSGLARAAVFGNVDKMEIGVTVCSDEDDIGNRRYPKYL